MIVYKANRNFVLLLFFLITILLTPGLFIPVNASEIERMSFKEAIEWGMENNYELNIIRNNIFELEKNLEIIDASESFQVDLRVTPIWNFGKPLSGQIKLVGDKQLSDDISLTTELSWESDNINQEDFDELSKEVNANLKLDKQIYPDSWPENEKQAYSIKNNLQMKLAELRWSQMEKQIEFIQGYLNIIRLQEQVDIARERRDLAEEELIRVKRQIKLGEGGYHQETEALIALEDAGNNLLKQEQNLNQAKKQWSLTLNLPENTSILFGKDIDFIQELYSRMRDLEIDNEKKESLIEKVLQENYQIRNSQLEKEELIKELEWTEDEGKAKVNLSGGYQFPGDWFVMVDFSVNLADGGVQEMKEEQKENNIKQKEISISYLGEQLKLEAEQLLDQDEYNRLYWNTQLLSLEKEQDKIEILEEQYHQGIISEAQWKNAILTLREKEIKVKQAEDEWLINRLRLAHFIGYLQEKF